MMANAGCLPSRILKRVCKTPVIIPAKNPPKKAISVETQGLNSRTSRIAAMDAPKVMDPSGVISGKPKMRKLMRTPSASNDRIKPNVSAPGRFIRSCVLGGNYAAYSGTSMAGPHVAGLVALLLSANPKLIGQVDSIEHIIEQTCLVRQSPQSCGTVSGLSIPNNTYGYGRIDALAAVKKVINIVPIHELKENTQVHFFPNPFSNQLNIEFKQIEGQTTFRLYSIDGRLLQTTSWQLHTFQRVSLETADWNRGFYMYSIENKGKMIYGKIVKE